MNVQNGGMFHSSFSEMRLKINKHFINAKSVAELV